MTRGEVASFFNSAGVSNAELTEGRADIFLENTGYNEEHPDPASLNLSVASSPDDDQSDAAVTHQPRWWSLSCKHQLNLLPGLGNPTHSSG